MASVLEALQNAEINLQNGGIGILFAKEQLHNALTLLEKGYDKYTEIEPLIDKYGSIDNVPDIDDQDEIRQDD